jgi:Cys-rich four helix bundle protein (predicted Tat secretion target)
MDRRQFIAAGASSIALTVGARALAQGAAEEKSGGARKSPAVLGNPRNRELADTASTCVKDGDICMQHCLELLAQGDKSMAKCSSTISAMLPMCRALEALAIQGSPHLADLARTCGKVCRECEASCKVHAGHHEACKTCMESCARCAAACEKATA